MSAALGIPILECVYFLGCARWVCIHCLYTGANDSKTWNLANIEAFETVPLMCQLVLAVYEDDLANPEYAPPGGYLIFGNNVVKKVDYQDTCGIVPPYIIYADHEHKDIVLAIRGLHLARESDYALLWNNKLGKQMFDGGYVHHGLLKAATWLLNKEAETLRKLVMEHPSYTLTFTGHSLGAGVASLAVVVLTKFRFLVANIPRKRMRCYAIAPARCMSLNLAIEYSDIINSIILQDDFLPRTATPLEDVFSHLFCLPCLLCFRCLRDICVPEKKLYKDPRRLYAPGRLYHIVERKFCRCGRYPPEVRTSIPVEGRFDHVILSCNATTDHSIVSIERESERAIEVMLESGGVLDAPVSQKMERQSMLAKEHEEEYRMALERARRLNISSVSVQVDKQEGRLVSQLEEPLLSDKQESITFPHLQTTEDAAGLEADDQAITKEWMDLLQQLFPKGIL